ncbi:MAG: hypothetical protein L6R36_008452 [Xanthoria steineri]|nr:MAG: hypothetical protein L6R36_008452 [Xanthoria steineri]
MLVDRTLEQGAFDIDKVDFLELYIPTRREGIDNPNIRSAWRESGLFPFQPNLVLMKEYQRLLPPNPKPQRPITPPDSVTFSNSSGQIVTCFMTPANGLEVKKILDKITSDLPEEQQQALFKLGKAASIAFATNDVAKADCEALRAGIQRKKDRLKNGVKGYYGKARVLNQGTIDRRNALLSDEEFGYSFDCFVIWVKKEFTKYHRLTKQAARTAVAEEQAKEKENGKIFAEQLKCFAGWCNPVSRNPTKLYSSPKKRAPRASPAPLQFPPPLPPSPLPSPIPSPRITAPRLLVRLKLPMASPYAVLEPTKQQEIKEIAGLRRSGRPRMSNPHRIRIGQLRG